MTEPSIQDQIAQKELEKLAAETKAIEQGLKPTPRWMSVLRALTPIGGLIAAVVAIGSLLLSVSQWWTEAAKDRQQLNDARFNAAISSIADLSVSKRIAGVGSLRTFIRSGSEDERQNALSILGSLLAVEQDVSVRQTIVSTFENLEPIEDDSLNNVLGDLNSASRALVIQGRLEQERIDHPAEPISPESIEARAAALGTAISTLYQKGARQKNASGIYCIRCNFSGLNLEGANFDDAILYLANFTGSSLNGASFDAADIEQANFTYAKLQNAKFTVDEGRVTRSGYSASMIERKFDKNPVKIRVRSSDGSDCADLTHIEGMCTPADSREEVIYEQLSFRGPDFSCANLQGADFTGFPLIGFAADDAEIDGIGHAYPPLLVFAPRFWRAELSDVDFTAFSFYGASIPDVKLPLPWLGGTKQPAGSKAQYFYYEFDQYADSALSFPEDGPFTRSMYHAVQGFAGSNWFDADIPDVLMHEFEDLGDLFGYDEDYFALTCEDKIGVNDD